MNKNDRRNLYKGISLCAKIGAWQRRSTGLLSQIDAHSRVCENYVPVTTTKATPTRKPGKYNKKPGKYGK